MKPDIPKVLAPDLEAPSADLRREAYELAAAVWDMKPWVDFVEEQVLAIRFADGAARFLSVLGSHGEYRALALYPDAASYWRIRGVDEGDNVDLMDAFMSTAQLQLYFGKSSELMRGERTAIKASGVKFPRGVNPSFVSYIPGFAPDAMGAGEMREALRFVKAFFGFRKDHMACEVRPLANQFDLFTTWSEDEDGGWTKGENDFSPMLPVAVSIDNALVEKVAALRVEENLFLEIGVFPVPAGRTPTGRGKMSKFILLVDGTRQFALGTDMIETPDERETDWTPILESVLGKLCVLGMRPKYFASTSRKMEAILKGLCVTQFNGSQLFEHASCDSAKAMFEEISAGLF